MRPTLAGRSRESIERLGRELGCETRTISLEDPRLPEAIAGFGCVLLAAGPFSRTEKRARIPAVGFDAPAQAAFVGLHRRGPRVSGGH
jgi:hypothetical protein